MQRSTLGGGGGGGGVIVVLDMWPSSSHISCWGGEGRGGEGRGGEGREGREERDGSELELVDWMKLVKTPPPLPANGNVMDTLTSDVHNHSLYNTSSCARFVRTTTCVC